MSFRLRVLALVALVAVIATTVTAWLTLRQASQQVTESADAQRQDIETITEELTAYGVTHGTWEGAAVLVDELGFRTGQRIRLVTDFGEVVVDTDTLAGRTARAVDSPPLQINPRPSLELPAGIVDPAALIQITLDEIDTYRSGTLLAACLTRGGFGVRVIGGPYGVPRHEPDFTADPARQPSEEDAVNNCHDFATVPDGQRDQDAERLDQCRAVALSRLALPEGSPAPDGVVDGVPGRFFGRRQELVACLAQQFEDRTAEYAPVPLLVQLGAVDDDPAAPLSTGPVLAAAALVAALAIAGSLLLSRRVLRPVRALTSASGRLGAGDLSERVPVVGRDELAGLARSFNRMADSLQRGEERQRRLVADVAHELRTPLANLRGYLEALKDGVVAPEPELFASLHEEAVLQQRIVDDLQELALAEAGTLIYHRSRVDLGELLEICRAAHQGVAEAADVRLTASGAGAGAGYVHADPDRLRQVLGNLVGNALRATPAGGSVSLTATRAGGWAVVTVADTGTGIAPEHLPHVFDRFWRGDPARGRATGGSGLGLAIARQIVTDHGGTITVDSSPGAGTRFTIRLPG
ncbi:MAG: HAMP domain-containing protein [Micromonosporaceae bacterium]|nr:HAMP domain-containing protein [Micromonosporaceae bacterium]